MMRKASRSPHQYFIDVNEVYVHPEFESINFANDVALLLMDKPIVFGRRVSPVCLPGPPGTDTDVEFGKECVAVGWGRIVRPKKCCSDVLYSRVQGEDSSYPESEHLREVIVPATRCKHDYNDDELQICGGYEAGGKDSCQGKKPAKGKVLNIEDDDSLR